MRKVLFWLLLGLVIQTPAASAQVVSAGLFASRNTSLDDGLFGVGAKVRVGVPVVGLRFEGWGELFFRDEQDDVESFAVNLLWGPPLPVVDLYFGAGLAVQNIEEGDTGGDREGLNLMVGAGFSGLFVDLRYQIMADVDDQAVIAVGFLVPIL